MVHGFEMPRNDLNILTDVKIRNLKPTSVDTYVNDGGGLYLVNRDYGAKQWVFRFTSPITLKRRKVSLGDYPDLSLNAARKLASDHRNRITQGQDPIFETEKAQNALKAEHKSLTERAQQTVKATFEEWKKRELQNRKDKGVEINRAFEKDVFPVIGTLHVGDVSRSDIKVILDRPLTRGGRRMANRLLSDIRQFFGFAIDEEYTEIDPTRRMSKARVGGIEKPRDRYLDETERKAFAAALPKSDLPEGYQHALWLILATGCRVDEISRMRWDHIDYNKRTLTIPAEHAKNKKEHTVYLSDFALHHLKALEAGRYCDWVFPNRQSDGPIHRQTLTKMIRDRQRKKNLKGRTTSNQSLIIGKTSWRPHDLRRTAATIMQELGIAPNVVMKCLNQSAYDPLIETYQRAFLKEKQQEAFTLLGNHLNSLHKSA